MEKAKVIVITGVSNGIGRALMKKMSSMDNLVVVGISRNQNRLDTLAEELGDHPGHLLLRGDIAAEAERNDIADRIKQRFGKVDVLIHNAGSLMRKPLNELSASDFQEIYSTNLFAPSLLSSALFPLLRRDAGGDPSHIVHIASMGGVQGSQKFPGLAAYSSSKAALIGMAECMAEEWRKDGIRSNVLAIGSVSTEMFKEAFPGFDAATTPEEMAAFIADFALTGQRLFNGKLIQVSNSTP